MQEDTEETADIISQEEIEKLKIKQQGFLRFAKCFACLILLSSIAFVWALMQWLSPNTPTSENWTLPLSFIFLADMIGMFVFSLQEFRKIGRQVKRVESNG